MSMSSSSSDEQLADDYERCEIDAIKAEQKLLTGYDCEKTRENEANATMDEMANKLTVAETKQKEYQEMNVALQMALWKSFPSVHLCYYIKAPSGNGGYVYLYAEIREFLCVSTNNALKEHFKFEKDSDGTFSICPEQGKYLQIQTSSYLMFCANVDNKSKFVLIFHPQQDKQQPGILVDIFSLANGCFLSVEGNQQNRLVANSPTAPSNKFLILGEDVELLASQELEKARAVQTAPGTDELKTELAITHNTISAFEMAFWKSFPSPHHYYCIKTPSENGGYGYLYINDSGSLCSSTGDDDPKGYFQFRQYPDGTFSIYSKSTRKYLKLQPLLCPCTSASFMFCGKEHNKSKFAIIFHPQQDKQQPGILFDIFVLANGCFLSPEIWISPRVMLLAKSPTAPSNKFLILAAGLE